MATQELDIFNLDAEAIEFHERPERGESVLYSPKAKDAPNGLYEALIRFIPNPKDPAQSLVRKYVYYLKDKDGKGKNYDSPSTIKGQKCPIQQTYYKLAKSESAVDRKIAKQLKRREQFYSIIQIIDDKVNPEMNGKFKIFKFGPKVKIKFDAEKNPTFGKKTQIYDLFNGKNFHLRLTRQGDFNNYDQCQFLKDTEPITVDGLQMEKTKAHMDIIRKELEKCPDLSNFYYKQWDDATESEVMSILRSMRNPGSSIDDVTTGIKDNTISNNEVNAAVTDFNELTSQKEAEIPVETTKKSNESTDDKSDDDELDAFLNQMENSIK